MAERPKILLLDDEQDLLETYRDVLAQLPVEPEIHLANSGARALALLESEPFDLLISDLRMPKMDGLQVLAIVRRKFPDLRVVVMTSIRDEQYRSRAYAMGVDLFWEKPSNTEEINQFKECIASLLGRGAQTGFRGVQSKSLMDIVQMECLSRNSSVLKISNGPRTGRVWVSNGDIIDALADEATGQKALEEIFSWKAGTFEILPAEPDHQRVIFESYESLLLNTTQAVDEARGEADAAQTASDEFSAPPRDKSLGALARHAGVDFVLEVNQSGAKTDAWGVENPETPAWLSTTWKSFLGLDEQLGGGGIADVQGSGFSCHVFIVGDADKQLCVGFNRNLALAECRQTMKKIREQWVS